MHVGSFPASAANSLIEGYCDDFTSFAATLAQTLEQVSMRQIALDDSSRDRLTRIESGMRELAEAIQELVQRCSQTSPEAAAFDPNQTALMAAPAPPPPEPEPKPSATARPPSFDHRMIDEREPPTPAARPAGHEQRRPPVSFPGHEPTGSQPTDRPARTQRRPKRRRQAEAAEQPDTSALRGNNETMPLLSVFQFIERTRKNGIMTVRMGKETMRFEFLHGCVQACATNAVVKGERLGDILLEADDTDIPLLNRLVAQTGNVGSAKLGELLIQNGAATNGQVMAALEMQIRRRFRRACKTRQAAYEFVDCMPSRTDGRIRIAPMELSHNSRFQG